MNILNAPLCEIVSIVRIEEPVNESEHLDEACLTEVIKSLLGDHDTVLKSCRINRRIVVYAYRKSENIVLILAFAKLLCHVLFI